MDELEISGKRYISTRRAAKEYKYHSDYIGQLIRGKKLLGRKVGRSWYVELDSLTEYFGKEGNIAPAPLVAKAVIEQPEQLVAEVVAETVPEVSAESIETKDESTEEKNIEPIVAQEIIKEEPVEIEIKKERDSIHIPVRVRRPSFETPEPKRSALTYISTEEDDAEFVPLAYPSRMRAAVATTAIMPRSKDELEEVAEEYNNLDTEEVISEEEFSAPPVTKNKTALVGVVALGVLVLVAAFGSSILLDSHTVIEAGKGASAGYTLH